MPVATDPNEIRWHSLAFDKKFPEETRPAFKLTGGFTRRVRLRFNQLLDEFGSAKDDEAAMAIAFKSIELGVSGWKNLPGEYSIQALEEVLSDGEIMELAWGWPEAWRVTGDDSKNLSSPLQSEAEQSVPNAVAGNAPTNQPT